MKTLLLECVVVQLSAASRTSRSARKFRAARRGDELNSRLQLPQISGDPGQGAVLGPSEGSADTIAAGLVDTTLIDSTPLVINLRHYEDICRQNRSEGSTTTLTGTIHSDKPSAECPYSARDGSRLPATE